MNESQQGDDRKNGFILLVFPFGDGQDQQVNYISNTNRHDVICAFKEITARLQGQPEMQGHA